MRGNQRWGAIAAVSLGQMVATLFYALPAVAQLNFGFGQRASDGTVYEVIAVNNSALAGGVDQMRITTVSGSINGINACSSGGAGVGQPMTAASGADPMSPAVLHPYDQVLRTGVLTPNNFTVTFDANNGGRLTIGTGVGAFDVCRNVSDCVAGAGDASVFTLSTPGGGIPAACIANGVTASCAGSAMLSTFAFGLNASGDPPTCSTLPTTTTSVCANPPADGFTVQKGQVVVFIYNHSLGMQGFSYGASGFGVDINDGLICSGNLNRVVTSDGQAPSAPPPIAPVSPSPTPTATNTPTQTPTPTATPSHSPTVTATATPTLTPIPCGNGTPNPGEQCDDGNRVNGDGCDNNCTFTGCGNGVLTTGEVCDDGNLVNGDGCDNNCKPTACGNGVVTSGEQCDDGNRVNGDGCDNNCTPTGCGNGIVTPPEKCDDGNFVNGDGCDNDCIAPVCGDGVVRAPEVCDDGNLNDADGCDSNCRPTGCGNGVATGTEMCDDGNAVNGDGCENNCFLTQCLPGHPAAIPGYCGSRRNDCAQEFCTLPAPPIDNQLSLPSNVFKCKEGDPTCDATIGDRVCTFRFALCYNTSDKRAPCNNTGRIESIKFRRPNQSAPRGSYDTDNRDAIEAGLKAIGGQVQGKCHNKAKKGQACSSDAACDTMSGTGDGVCANRRVTFSPLMTTPNLCTPLIKFEVPLRLTASGVAFGRADLRIRAHEPKPGKSDGDILKFICQP